MKQSNYLIFIEKTKIKKLKKTFRYAELEKVNELNHNLEQTINQLKIENTKLKEEIKTNIFSWNDEREIFSKK